MGRKRSGGKPRRTHPCATTTPAIRRAIQASEEKNTVLAKRYGVNRKTVAKCKGREFEFDQPMGPKKPRSSVLSQTDEAIILVFRYGTRLSLDDCLERLRRQMPKLSRSRLYGCLKRHGLSRIGRTAMTPLSTPSALNGPYSFEISAQ